MGLPRGRRRWAALAAAVIVVAGGGGAWALTRPSSASTLNYTLVAASRGTIRQAVTTTGTLEPARQSALTFGVSGTVTSVAATVGKKVAKGAVLATIDSTTLQTAVTTATASVTAAEQQLSSVAGSSSTQVAAAQAQLAAAEATLARAQDDLAAASLTAPFAGVVATVGLAVGDTVGSSAGGTGTGAQGGSSTTGASNSAATSGSAITLITTNAWIVNVGVGSSDLPALKNGQQAEITATGSNTKIFGTISSIGIVATSTSGSSATFPVVVAVTGNPTGLFAGSSASVSLIVKQVSNVLSVPTLALHTTNGKTVVYQRVDGKRVSTPVTIGTSYGPTTEINSGLKAGDKVEISFARPGGTTTRRGGNNQQQRNFGPPGGNG